MNWIAFLAGGFVGSLVGSLGMVIVLSLLNGLQQKYVPVEEVDEYTEDPVGDLAGLATEVLRQMERPYWDHVTVFHMATWLHDHQYTPLSDPAEIIAVVQREC